MRSKDVVQAFIVSLFWITATQPASATGSFHFVEWSKTGLPSAAWSFLAVDFPYPGDGADDLIATHPSVEPRQMLGTNGAGSFAFQSLPGPVQFTTWQSGDLNGDGALDVLIYNAAAGTVQVAASPNYVTQTWATLAPAAGWKFVIGEFTNDGLSDVIGYYEPNGTLHRGTNLGGSFSFAQVGSVAPATGWLFAAGQLDASTTIAELVGYHPSNDTIWVGALQFGLWFSFALWDDTTDRGWQFTQVLSADLNGDGRTDMIGYDGQSGEIVAGLNTGSASFLLDVWANAPAPGNWRFTTGRFAGHPQPDLVGFDANAQKLWVGVNVQSQCDNGVDDDADGAIDYPADTLCRSFADNNELANPSCGLGAELLLGCAAFAVLRGRIARATAS